MSSSCTPCYMHHQSNKQIRWQACRCSGNEPVSVVLQEPFNKSFSPKKTTLVNWPTDKEESNCKTRSMHKYSKLFVFQLFTSFRVFPFRLKPKSTWLHQNWNVPTNNCKCSDRIFHHLAMDHTTGPRNCSLPRKTVAAHKRSGGSWKSQLTLKP